jgi:hypothetical protein
MKKVEKACDTTITTRTIWGMREGFLILIQEFQKDGTPDSDTLRYFVTLGPEDIKELILEFQEFIKKFPERIENDD